MFAELGQRIHLLGARGQGLGAIGVALAAHGHQVTACDSDQIDPANQLHSLAAQAPYPIAFGNDRSHLRNHDTLIVASNLPDQVDEIHHAKITGMQVLRREDVLALIVHHHSVTGIAGVFGKSTTSAACAYFARLQGHDPLVFMGAVDPNNGNRNYSLGCDAEAIVEACEFRHAFLKLQCEVAVVLNTYSDEHPECYPSRADVLEAFCTFGAASSQLIIDGDQVEYRERIETIRGQKNIISVGEARSNHIQITTPTVPGGPIAVVTHDHDEIEFRTSLLGRHNAKHLVIAAVAMALTYREDSLLNPLRHAGGFVALARRLEIIWSAGSQVLIDDYAHHPTQLVATAKAIRDRWPMKRTAILFQPYGRKRIQRTFKALAAALAYFDVVYLLDIHAGPVDVLDEVCPSTADLLECLTSMGVVAFIIELQAVIASPQELFSLADTVAVCGSRPAGGIAGAIKRTLLESGS